MHSLLTFCVFHMLNPTDRGCRERRDGLLMKSIMFHMQQMRELLFSREKTLLRPSGKKVHAFLGKSSIVKIANQAKLLGFIVPC